MGLDVDILCQNLDLEDLRNFTEELSSMEAAAALKRVQERAVEERESDGKDKVSSGESSAMTAETSASTATHESASTAAAKSKEKNSGPAPWTKDELSTLAKGVKKYPPGGANRWDHIAKYNDVTRPGNSTSAPSPAKTEAPTDPESSKPSADATSTVNGTNGSAEEWTPDQDQLLQKALATYPASMDKNERWSSIAAAVPGKSKKECVQRFKAIREALKKS